MLPRFIVRTHVLSEHQLRWCTGVILQFEGDRALVKADPQDRCVSISVDGPGASRRRLLAAIRSDFERIHRSFKFNPKELRLESSPSSSDWKNTPFSKLQFLPKNAEAVTQWGDRDAAWLNVQTGIKRVVESLKSDKRL